jgi:hypothetical protein
MPAATAKALGQAAFLLQPFHPNKALITVTATKNTAFHIQALFSASELSSWRCL